MTVNTITQITSQRQVDLKQWANAFNVKFWQKPKTKHNTCSLLCSTTFTLCHSDFKLINTTNTLPMTGVIHRLQIQLTSYSQCLFSAELWQAWQPKQFQFSLQLVQFRSAVSQAAPAHQSISSAWLSETRKICRTVGRRKVVSRQTTVSVVT